MIGALSRDHIAELILRIVGKVRRVRNVYAAFGRRQRQLDTFGLSGLVRRDRAGFGHRFQNLVAARPRGVEIVIRIVAIRTANQAGEKRRFRQSQSRHVFVEIRARRFAKTVNRKA